MAKNTDSSIKLLVLYDILLKSTDEEHALSTNEIIEELKKRGISVSRKVLPSDIDLLTATDNIIFLEAKKYGNSSIIYNIDAIETAIKQKKKVSFFYYRLDENKNKVYNKDKKRYVFNPLSLIWSKDNYYLLCYDDRHDGTSRYRIDKMESVTVEDEPILEKDEFKNFDSETYRKQVFSMFGGELEKVTIQFDKELLSDVYDKFGTDIGIQRKYGGALETTLSVQVSKTFFLWVVGTLGKVKIIKPNNVKERFDSFVKEITDNY